MKPSANLLLVGLLATAAILATPARGDGRLSPQGGTITAVNAGAGLTGGATSGAATLTVDTSVIQSRVSGTCSAGNAVRVVASDGSVTCQAVGAGSVTSVASGNGLTGGPITGSGTLAIIPATSTTIYNAAHIATWGDSITAGTAGPPSWTVDMAGTTRYQVFNGGNSGDTSTQIKTRMLAATDKYGWPTILWPGRNNFASPSTVKADIASMVAALGHTNYIVLSVLNGDNSIEWLGGSDYVTITTLNNDLAAIYGSHYLDIRAYLVSQYNPGIPQDVIDHGHDVSPSSLRADFLHPNAAGNVIVANYLISHIALLQGDPVRTIVESDIPYLLGGPLNSVPTMQGDHLAPGMATDNGTTFQIGALLTASTVLPALSSTPGVEADVPVVIHGTFNPLLTIQNTSGSGTAEIDIYANNGAKFARIAEQTSGAMLVQNTSTGGLNIAGGSGGIVFFDGSTSTSQAVTGAGNFELRAASLLLWSNTTSPTSSGPDVGLERNAANVLAVNCGTAGTRCDLITRALYLNGTTKHTAGTGVPAISCAIGDEFDRTDGASGTTLYSCTATNTWTAVAGGAGTITGVTAGTGLSGGGSSGTVTITANLAGASCSAGSYMSALGATGTGTCTAEVGDISSVTAGTSLTGGGTSGAVTLNVSLPGASCSAGNHVSAIAADGTGTCSADTGSSGISGLTTNKLVKATSSTTIGNANTSDDGSSFIVGPSAFTVNESTGATVVGGQISIAGVSFTNGTVYAQNSTQAISFDTNTNAAATANIDTTGYSGGMTQARSVIFFDGQGSSSGHQILKLDGTNTNVSIPNGSLSVKTTALIQGVLTAGPGTDAATVTAAAAIFENNGTTSIAVRDASDDVELAMTVSSLGQGNVGTSTNHSLGLMTNGNVGFQLDTSQRAKFISHVGYDGSAPALSSCGSGSSIDSDSNDSDGDITVGSSTSSCVVTFAGAYTNKAICTATPNAVAITNVAVTAQSASSFTVSGQGSFGGGTAHIYYHCSGMKGF